MVKRLNLIRDELAKLTPGAKPYERWDSKVRNLCVRVQPSGRQTFYFVYRNKWHRIGPANAHGGIDPTRVKDVAEARRETQRIIGLVLDGQMVAAERGGDTFGELHPRYLRYAEKKNKSWRQAERLIKNHVLPKWADRDANSISDLDVHDLFDAIPTKPLANQVLAAVSAVFTFAVKRKVIKVNPARGIESYDVGEGRERVLSDDELGRLKTALEEIDPVRRAALAVILLTGQRPGEVARMRREHIRDNWWELPGKAIPELGWNGTKNKKTHRVYLVEAVRKLTASTDQTGFVFVNQAGKAISSLDEAMRRISKRLDDPPATPHDLRRTLPPGSVGATTGSRTSSGS
jgi:integrase